MFYAFKAQLFRFKLDKSYAQRQAIELFHVLQRLYSLASWFYEIEKLLRRYNVSEKNNL